FVVRSGMTDKSFGIDEVSGDGANQLHLFAAHDIRTIVLDGADAGNDGLPFARPDQPFDKLVDAGRTGHIRRLLPTAVRSDHSSEQQRPVAKPLANLPDRVGEAAGRHRKNALLVLEFLRAPS